MLSSYDKQLMPLVVVSGTYFDLIRKFINSSMCAETEQKIKYKEV